MGPTVNTKEVKRDSDSTEIRGNEVIFVNNKCRDTQC